MSRGRVHDVAAQFEGVRTENQTLQQRQTSLQRQIEDMELKAKQTKDNERRLEFELNKQKEQAEYVTKEATSKSDESQAKVKELEDEI